MHESASKPDMTSEDPQDQEAINLHLAGEKLGLELSSLRRPYWQQLLSNPQFLTAMIQTVGAVIGVSLLIHNNYFEVQSKLNQLLAEKAKGQVADAEKQAADAKRALSQANEEKEKARKINAAAEHEMAGAYAKTAEASKIVDAAKRRIAEITQAADEVKARLDSVTIAATAQHLLEDAEKHKGEETAVSDVKEAQMQALRAWRRAHTEDAQKALFDSYKHPVAFVNPFAFVKDGMWLNQSDFAPNSFRLATITAPEGLEPTSSILWGLGTDGTLKKIATLGAVESVNFSHDGNRILTAGPDNFAIVWDAINGRRTEVQKEHQNSVTYAKFSFDDNQVLSADSNGSAVLWAVSDPKKSVSLNGKFVGLYGAFFSPNGKLLVTLNHDESLTSTVQVWNALNGELLYTLKCGSGNNPSSPTVRFSRNSEKLVWNGCGEAESASIVDASRGKTIGVFALDKDRSVSAHIADVIVVTDAKGIAVVFDPRARTISYDLPTKGAFYKPMYTATGQRVFGQDPDGRKFIWDIMTGKIVYSPALSSQDTDALQLYDVAGGVWGITILDYPPEVEKRVEVFRIVPTDDVARFVQ